MITYTPRTIERVQVAGGMWELLEDVEYNCDGHSIIVPEGFKLDGTTVPWWLRWPFPQWHRKYNHAIVLHDWLYGPASDQDVRIVASAMSEPDYRKGADLAMLHLSQGWRRKFLYSIARIFGRPYWLRIME